MGAKESVEREGSWFRKDIAGLQMHRDRLVNAILSPTYNGKYRVYNGEDGIGFFDRTNVLEELEATNAQIDALKNTPEITFHVLEIVPEPQMMSLCLSIRFKTQINV